MWIMISKPTSLAVTFVATSLVFAVASHAADEWKSDPIWHDGLVEKAVYRASRVVYGAPRMYQMIAFTNKEQHDRKTLTKADKSNDTIEVFKHNQIEVIPTPNYDYKYETTSHLAVDDLELTRLDCSSQEFCGTSFKQFLRTAPGKWDYWSFSYMPEAGRQQGSVSQLDRPVVAADSLPLFLRDYDFANRQPMKIALLPDQTSNRPTASEWVNAGIRYAGEEDGAYKLEVFTDTGGAPTLIGTYWMAKDRLHVMIRYLSADGQQSYELTDLSRVNYWTIQKS